MPQIPLPTGIKGDKSIPRLQELLVNMFNPGDNTLLLTPGITSLSTGQGKCRGAITFNERHYQVSGTSLIRVNEDGTTVVIGTIEGTADVDMAVSFIALEIVVKAATGKGYSMDTSEVLVEIVDPDFKSSIEVASINQRFVFVPFDGGPLFFTDVNFPTVIPALNFFDAELLPDRNTGVINLRNNLYVGGEDSFEVFRDIGDVDAPFQRVDGAAIETGYLTAKARYKDTFVFLGRDRDGSFAFHAMGSGDAPKISIPQIDEILNNEYTLDELKLCTSQRQTRNGVDMVSFRLARDSFLFYGTGWAYIQSGIDGLGTQRPWDVNHLAFTFGKYITGSAIDTKIGILDDGILEFGEEIERTIQTFIRTESDAYFRINNIFLSCSTGSSLVEGSVALQISRDNLTFGPQVPRGLGAIGQTERQLSWYGGGGVFERFAALRLRTTSDVSFSTDGLAVNVQ